MNETKVYGMHVVVDGYGGSKQKLADVTLVYELLNRLPAMIGMQKVGFPHIIQFTEGDIAGLSGFVFILESHISIHTYACKGFFSFDAFSCKPFDPEVLYKELKSTFDIVSFETKTIERGSHFPLKCI
jgi:S-adenosylmethionine/arginine decarboxylase-like enzyme